MIDADDDFFKYSNLIADLGSSYAKCDEYRYYADYVCVALNRMKKTQYYSFMCDMEDNTHISMKDRSTIILGNFQNDDYLKQLYEFFQNEILLFKLENLK